MEPQGVLVDADDDFVLQDTAGFGADGPQVIGHEERGSHDRPQGHLSTRLVHAEAEVTHNQLWRSEGRRNDTETEGRHFQE